MDQIPIFLLFFSRKHLTRPACKIPGQYMQKLYFLSTPAIQNSIEIGGLRGIKGINDFFSANFSFPHHDSSSSTTV